VPPDIPTRSSANGRIDPPDLVIADTILIGAHDKDPGVDRRFPAHPPRYGGTAGHTGMIFSLWIR